MKLTITISVALLLLPSSISSNPIIKRAPDVYDDADFSRLTYDPLSAWVHLSNQGSTLWGGTESYTKQSNAQASVARSGGRNLMRIYAAKKNDRDVFDVFRSTTGTSLEFVGTGDAYGACTGAFCRSAQVFELYLTPQTNPNPDIQETYIIKNRASDPRVNGPLYLAVDRVEWI